MPVQTVDIKDLRAKRANIWTQMCEVMDGASNEGRAMNEEEKAKYERGETELDEVGEHIAQMEAHAQRERDLDQVDRSDLPDAARGGKKDDDDGLSEEERQKAGVAGTKEYHRAFDQWIRGGLTRMSTEAREHLQKGWNDFEGRAAGVGTPSAGGYTVPPAFRNRIVERMKQITAVRDVAMVISTDTGATLPWPTVDDTANVGAILAENTQVAEQDVVFGTAQLAAYMYTSKLTRVSYQLMNDAGFDVQGLLARFLATRIGRIQNQHFTTGTGTAQPQGLVTGGTVGATLATGSTTGFSSVTTGYDGLIDLLDALDPAYLGSPNLTWMFAQAFRKNVRKLKDSQNRPLWEPSIQVGQPDSLLGYPIKLNNDMPAWAANAKVAAFGDFEEGYVIRDVNDFFLLRLDERYADFLQTGFVGFMRSDGATQNAFAYTLLQASAT